VKAVKERGVLITNLNDVSIDTGFGKVRTHTNALVLSDRGPKDDTGARYRAHGFHNEAGNPTFDLTLPSFDWTIEPQSYKRAFVLCFAGQANPRIVLTTDFANEEPLDIVSLDRPDWGDLLLRKVLRYYHAPYIVLGQQLDADQAREVLGVEGIDGASR
jgi:hypothetical protein